MITSHHQSSSWILLFLNQAFQRLLEVNFKHGLQARNEIFYLATSLANEEQI